MSDDRACRSSTLHALLALAIIGAGACLDLGGGAIAQASQRGPWCAYLGGHGSGFDCSYFTFEQCMATARGLGGFCSPNPRAVAPSRRQRGGRY
jgi:hypothetical protein